MNVTVLDHPLARVRLSILRDERTTPSAFRQALEELTDLLVLESTRDLHIRVTDIRTPVGPTAGAELARPPMIVPILRAGLGMLSAVHRMLPDSPVGFLGLKRNEETLLPDAYVSTIPDDLDGRGVLLLDPMLATGGSLISALEMLAARSSGPIVAVCILASPEGIATVAEAGFSETPGLRIVTASVDERLNDVGFIVPGLGDAGDRQFGVA